MSPETTEQEAPYAYPNAVLGLIHRYREGALPDPITPSALKPFGLSPNNAHRLLGALGFPGLIDDGLRATSSSCDGPAPRNIRPRWRTCSAPHTVRSSGRSTLRATTRPPSI